MNPRCKRFSYVLISAFIVAAVLAFSFGTSPAMWKKSHKAGGAATSVGIMRGLTFHAPFEDADNPLTIYKGTGSFTFSRVHDATHTATYSDTTVADNNSLRVESLGALIEGQRTNLFAKSEVFDSPVADWNPLSGSTSIASDATTAPDGNATADSITDSAASNPFGVYQAEDLTVANYTLSVYAKKNTGNGWLALDFSNGANTGAVLNLNTGVVSYEDGTLINSGIGTFTGGWYRGWIVDEKTVATYYPEMYLSGAVDSNTRTYLGDGSNSVYVWGSQLELGSFPSSYIPTNLTTMTRNADDLSIATAGNIDNTAGGLTTDWSPVFDNNMVTGAEYPIFAAGDMEAYYNATDQKIYFTDGTNTVSTSALTFSAGDTKKLAFRWGSGGLDIYIDGASAATGASFTEPGLGDTLYIGRNVAGDAYLYGHVKNLRVFNRELTDPELQTLTQ